MKHRMKLCRLPIIIIVASLILSACRPSQSASENISFMVFGDPAELDAYQKLVESFKRANPEIQVELIQIPGQSDYRKRLAADIAAGNPADVVLINYRRFATFAMAGALEPLGGFVFGDSSLIKEADFYPQALQAFKWRGE